MGICDDAGFGAVSEFEVGGLIGLIGGEFTEVVVGGLAAKGIVENENREEGEDDEYKGSCAGEVVSESWRVVHRFRRDESVLCRGRRR